MNIPIFEFIIDDEDKELGMKAISLVDHPAIESSYIAFDKQSKLIQFKDDTKYIISGLALIPDKLIYRINNETNEEFYGYFSAETIETIMNKFMKESTSGTLQNVNFGHDSKKPVEAHLIESVILRTDEMVDAIKAMGIDEAIKGSWFVSYKFDNEEDYNNAVEGGFTGFSIEVMLQKELKMNKNNNKNNDKFMTKVKDFIDKFKAILNEFEDDKVNLEDKKIADSDVVLRYGEVGQPVLKVIVAEDGTESTEVMPEGDYVLEDGNTLVVNSDGNLVEIKEKADPEPLPEEDMNKIKTPEVKLEEVKTDLDKTLRELIPLDKNGDYSISVAVIDGELKYGSMSSWTEIKMAVEADKQKEIDELKLQLTNANTLNTELKDKLDNIVIKPLFNDFNTIPEKISKDEYKKMNNLEYQLRKLGLDKEK